MNFTMRLLVWAALLPALSGPVTPHRSQQSAENFIAGTLTDIGEPVEFYGQGVPQTIAFELSNTGAALTDFALLAKMSPDASGYQTLISGATWNTVAGNLKEVAGTLNTLASGSKGAAVVEIGPVYAFKFQASIGSGVRNKGTLTAAANATNTAASGVLTLTGQPSDTQTCTIGSSVYIFDDTTLVDEPFHVLIGATASDTIDNLVAAITGGAGEGTLYGTDTPAHTLVTAANGTGDTMDVTALTPGTAGNAIATTDTMSNASWGAANLAGGTTETVTTDDKTYTFKADGFVEDAYDVLIGANASDTLDNLIAAHNGAAGEGTLYGTGTEPQTRVTASAGAGDTMVVEANADIPNAVGTLIVTTETCAQLSWGATTLADGVMTDIVVSCTTRVES